MSKLVWDAAGTRTFETGVSHGVLYPRAADGTYEKGVVWNGLTSVSESPEGAEANDLWADDMKYASFRSAETFGATIEAYTYPDEWADCDGSATVVTGVYVGQQRRKPFGFSFRSCVGSDANIDLSSDLGYKIHIIWGATASPSERSYETINDSPDAITFSWEITTVPMPVAGGYKPTSSMTIDTTRLTSTADRAKLQELEDLLYGTASTDPQLPTPDQVIAIFTGTSA